DAVVAIADLGAAGLTCALAELAARSRVGVEVDLDCVPLRESGMSPHEVLLSESQERMLLVVKAGREGDVAAVFDRYELHATAIGQVIAEPVVRCSARGATVCEVPTPALVDDAPRYAVSGARPSALEDRLAQDLLPLAVEPPSIRPLLDLLASPSARDRRAIWRRYDHMNGINTLVGPGAGDAAVLRIKGTRRGVALAIDGPGPARLGALDPYLAGASAVLEGALNVACSGATPIGITDCLNFGSPETPVGGWQLERAIDGIADACRALGIPVVSGNVSLYNETPAGPIMPTPVVGTVGLLEDRRSAVPMAWSAGDEVWLLGDDAFDAAALAGSELAWRHGLRGGRPALDIDAAARVAMLLPRLAASGLLRGAHDLSVGGLGVALARLAIATGVGASVALPPVAAAVPTAALFGERAGRVLVAVAAGGAHRLGELASQSGVPALTLGMAGGERLIIGAGGARIECDLAQLAEAYATGF
ncbi:MAG: AIR synthase-related protein, partial [Candidatus Limnocylindria bacterium]